MSGLVDNRLAITYEQLLALPARDQYTTLQCISNFVGDELIGNALWRGVSLSSVLTKAGLQPGATHLLFRSDDGYIDSLPLDFAMREQVMLAYEMNGEPLPREHGFPLRLLAPGIYGMKHPKRLTDIVVMDEEVLGFWQQRGWSQTARMNTSVRIDVPGPGSSLDGSPSVVEGIAFSGDRGIAKVEVSDDGGSSWQPAQLKAPLGPDTWVLWRFDWLPSNSLRGPVDLQARATDGAGETQTADRAQPFPSGATGYNSVGISLG